MEEPIVRVDHLSHRYSVQWAIRDINLQISKKGVFGLLGSNGAGKSTTMDIICGVLDQPEGDVHISGIGLREDPVQAKRYIGFLPQRPPLYTDATVDEYLMSCARLRLMDPKEVRPAVDRAKEKCGIMHFRRRLIGNLSGGYQQRVGIAQAIVHSPKFVVLDEPTNGLDPNQIVEIRNLIKELASDHAVMLSTHILSEVQATCNEIRMIESGHVVFTGTMDDFDNYVAPTSFLVVWDNPPTTDELAALDGVTGSEDLGDGSFRVHFDRRLDITERVIDRSVRSGWGLKEIRLERRSLDEIFARLSKGEG